MPHLGARVANAWRRSPLGTAVVGLAWVLAGVVLAATGADLALRARATVLERRDTRRFAALARAYEPCLAQQLDPRYLFFFHRSLDGRVDAGNDVCGLDAAGFREPGPARATRAKLAFLLGGSAAFGQFASSDATTITSYLNQLQDEYFFVNAGVPGFTSTQDFYRLSLEVLSYQPALVVAYNGVNDVDGASRDPRHPPGTPGNFPALEELVDRGLGPWRWPTAAELWPELAERWSGSGADEGLDTPPDAIDAAADRYLENHRLMADLSRARGARYLAVLQPMAVLHRHVDPAFAGPPRVAERFRARVTGADKPFAFVDFGSFFDEVYDRVPVMGADLDADTVFVDPVHLADRGNHLVAERLWRALSAGVLR